VDYTFPIPKNSLISRFSPIFSRLTQNQNSTIVALPYTGRTSLLRFISNSPDTQKLLGLNPDAHRLLFIDTDRTDYSYSQFLKELAFCLSPDSLPPSDDYLTSVFIHQQVKELSRSAHLVFIITLNWQTINSLSDIDRFLSLLTKSATPHSVNYLWSIDTAVLRQITHPHPSSTLLEKLFYFPAFSPAETTHSLKRLCLSKNLSPKSAVLSHAQVLTGGIAGFFHSLINLGPQFINHPSLNPVITLLKSEVTQSPDLISFLTTPATLQLLNQITPTHIPFGNLTLNQNPTAQEINLLKLFESKLNSPVSRDDVAQVLWGQAWQQKYSDWALDKAVSRLRKLIIQGKFRLITVKNFGYQLTDFI